MTEVGYCQQAKDFLEAFAESVRDLIRLHEDQFQALVGGDPEAQRFDDLIHIANERRHQAKYDYVHHLETHGCSR
jgi:hypothetical protein